MPVRIKRGSSRLEHAELVVVDGIEFWTRPDIPDIEPDSTDVYHTTHESERIDIIAGDKYNKQEWWWVLAHRNDYRLLPFSLSAGNRMVVPRASRVRKELF